MKSTRFFVFLFFSFHFHTGNVIRWGSKETIQNLQVIEPCRSALYRVRNYHEVDIGIICRTIIFQRYTLSYYMCIRYTYRNMCKRSLDVIIKDVVHWTCIERAVNRVVFHKIWKVYKCVDRTNSGRFLVLIKMYVLWFQVYRFSCFVRAISVTTVEKRTNGKNRWIYTSAWNAVSSHDSLAKSAEENLNTNTISRSITSLSTITSICLCCELRFKIEYRIFDLSNVLSAERILHDNLHAKKMRLTRKRLW